MPFKVGPVELLIILAIVIAIFGAGKLASLGGALGKGVKDFRSAVKDPDEKSETEGEGKTSSSEKATSSAKVESASKEEQD